MNDVKKRKLTRETTVMLDDRVVKKTTNEIAVGIG